MSAAPLGLPRAQRIKLGRDFSRIRGAGRRVVKGCLIANWMETPSASRSKLGVIAGRQIGNAVVRGRAKRLLREVFRLHQNQLKLTVEMVLVARPSIVGRGLDAVQKDFLGAMCAGQLLETSA